MQENAGPVATSLLVVFIAWLGPVVGPYALIVFAAAAGCLVPLTRRKEGTRIDGVLYLITAVGLALVFVAPLAYALDRWASLPAHIVLAPLAAIVGIFRDQLLEAGGTWVAGLPAALANLNPFAGRGRSGQ